MKKIRVGDVVVITTPNGFYGDLGIIKSKYTPYIYDVQTKDDDGSDYIIPFSFSEFEVIDHIDEEEPKFMVGYTGPKNYYDKEPNALTKDGPVYNSEPLKDNVQEIKIKPKFKVGDRVIVCGQWKGVIEKILPHDLDGYRYITKETSDESYSFLRTGLSLIYESSIKLEEKAAPIKIQEEFYSEYWKRRHKEDEQINIPGQVPLTINGMDVRAVIDPARAEVVVICTNCKHIIKTIDLKK